MSIRNRATKEKARRRRTTEDTEVMGNQSLNQREKARKLRKTLVLFRAFRRFHDSFNHFAWVFPFVNSSHGSSTFSFRFFRG
jgi:hypothetical protein